MKMLLREALDREEAASIKPKSVRRRKASWV